MEKDFAPYPESMELKELGFDEPCLFAFDNCSTPMRCSNLRTNEQKFNGVNYNSSTYTSQPTFSQAFRWFRENHGLFIAPNVISYENGPYLWFFVINSTILPFGTDLGETDDFNTYEEAELACLRKLIEIAKLK